MLCHSALACAFPSCSLIPNSLGQGGGRAAAELAAKVGQQVGARDAEGDAPRPRPVVRHHPAGGLLLAQSRAGVSSDLVSVCLPPLVAASPRVILWRPGLMHPAGSLPAARAPRCDRHCADHGDPQARQALPCHRQVSHICCVCLCVCVCVFLSFSPSPFLFLSLSLSLSLSPLSPLSLLSLLTRAASTRTRV
jgi:hypothetical protein